ncbi:PEP-CTERM sorting domain-containing protein [Aquabacterium sp. A7-Y]|uniref:PEP-CTERM sorting domain-containing protein n=1 Tax=Aquabacterium sp. A7-Y TaxID=1349605 RepID=UPI00223D6737|nr:PEP-CTERM sorting domain-containing protein [Aquabacterium sp. A7-Y]MCW7536910.1 PEP-CTERM sorting domain-containing protein [Aquabacterium sp. A7-Y]
MTLVPASQCARLLTLASAAHLAACSAAALAADTRWTGAAGPDAPFWDLESNWSAGGPSSSDTRALLGASDTTIRHGAFLAGHVIGQGRLTLTGGNLGLSGPGSTLGHLDLRGGRLGGKAAITAGSLQWSAGGFAVAEYGSLESTLKVSGAAALSGTLDAGTGTSLQLNGPSQWKDGPSSMKGGYFTLGIGAGASFHDHADSGPHVLDVGEYGRLLNDGRYLKTGAGTTTWRSSFDRSENRGLLEVQGGRLNIDAYHASFDNLGEIRIEKASTLSISSRAIHFRQNGMLHVRAGGTLDYAPEQGVFASTGAWTIEKGGRVDLRDAGWHSAPPGVFPCTFTGGAIHNDGTLVFRGGPYGDSQRRGSFILDRDVAISGSGSFENIGGVEVQIGRDLHVGRLRIAEPVPYDPVVRSEHVFSRVAVAGIVIVDELDWEDGFLDTTGDVTVLNAARLSNDGSYWKGMPTRRMGKEINTAFTFLRHAEWDGDGDLFGTGNVRVATGARFEDHNSQGTLEYVQGDWLPRPTRIEVASFVNQGSYVKSGAGVTVVQSRFDNPGTVRAVGAAPLVFAGALNNTGTLEAVRSRIVVTGPLAQWQDGVLTAGQYVARNGTLLFESGQDPGATQPRGIVRNETTIVLDGPQARLSTLWLGLEHDALRLLHENTGQLEVLNGATLASHTQLVNRGQLLVAGGGTVQAENFSQTYEPGGPTPSTWIDGTLKGRHVMLHEGEVGPGTRGGTGVAHVVGSTTFAEGATLLLDIQDESAFDQLQVSGSVELKGAALVDFLGTEPVLGTFRVLTATEGIVGEFASLSSTLDPEQYRLSVRYTSNYLELTVTPVPEPGTLALAGLGLTLLAARHRRSGFAGRRVGSSRKSSKP